MKVFSRLSDGISALFITIIIYAVFFAMVFMSPGDEMNNSFIALATFVSMTFFINFPLCWWVIKRIIKANRKQRN
ncbi:hypothetical protein [Neobacillus drentensis]|uniref:hypothetical protein n=1 Tax=Neobacillus drentensis TaxID=220684 RepID=UPI0030004A11